MSGGIHGANVRIHDDTDAVARARHALCHQLRVLHNIRIRGPGTHAVAPASLGLQGRSDSGGRHHGASAKLISLGQKQPEPHSHHRKNSVMSHDTGSSHHPQGSGSKPPVKEFDQQYFRVFHGDDPNFEDEPQGPEADIVDDPLQPESGSSSRVNSGYREGADNQSLFASFWWLLRDLLLLFCVVGVIYLLLYCCCCDKSLPVESPSGTTEGTFDAIY